MFKYLLKARPEDSGVSIEYSLFRHRRSKGHGVHRMQKLHKHLYLEYDRKMGMTTTRWED